jgi:glutathione S-transferase
MRHLPTLYYTAGSGNSLKPALVAHHLGLALHREHIDVLGGASRQPAFLAINPRGQLPYLVTADGHGLGESNAIAWFLAEGSALLPRDALQRAQVVQWMIFEQTALEPFISPARFFSHILPAEREPRAAQIAAWQAGAVPGLRRLDDHLAVQPFMVGDQCTVADIAVYGYTHLAPEGGIPLGAYPGVQAWVSRVQAALAIPELAELLPC